MVKGMDKAALYVALSETLGSMAFLEVAPMSFVSASIPVFVPWKGSIQLVTSKEFARLVIGAVEGGSEEFTAEPLMIDAVAEIANTIAGLYLNAIVGDDGTFEIGLPVKGIVTSFESDGEEWHYFNVAGNIIAVSVQEDPS